MTPSGSAPLRAAAGREPPASPLLGVRRLPDEALQRRREPRPAGARSPPPSGAEVGRLSTQLRDSGAPARRGSQGALSPRPSAGQSTDTTHGARVRAAVPCSTAPDMPCSRAGATVGSPRLGRLPSPSRGDPQRSPSLRRSPAPPSGRCSLDPGGLRQRRSPGRQARAAPALGAQQRAARSGTSSCEPIRFLSRAIGGGSGGSSPASTAAPSPNGTVDESGTEDGDADGALDAELSCGLPPPAPSAPPTARDAGPVVGSRAPGAIAGGSLASDAARAMADRLEREAERLRRESERLCRESERLLRESKTTLRQFEGPHSPHTSHRRQQT